MGLQSANPTDPEGPGPGVCAEGGPLGLNSGFSVLCGLGLLPGFSGFPLGREARGSREGSLSPDLHVLGQALRHKLGERGDTPFPPFPPSQKNTQYLALSLS